MKVDLFDFDLPQELIALRPARPRDAARMLVVQGDAPFADCGVLDLPGLLRAGDVLVCYQRARRQKDWRGRARRAFANAPGLPSFDVEVLRSELARDVLLLAAKKAP